MFSVAFEENGRWKLFPGTYDKIEAIDLMNKFREVFDVKSKLIPQEYNENQQMTESKEVFSPIS